MVTTNMQESIEKLRTQSISAVSDEERVLALTDLAQLLNRNDPDEAYKAARSALRVARKSRDPWLEGLSLQSVGAVHTRRGDYATGLDYFHRAYALFEGAGREQGVAASCYSIAAIHKDLGKYFSAIEYAKRSHEIFARNDKPKVVAIVANQLGIIHSRLAEFDTALEYLLPAAERFHELGEKYWEATVLHNIGMVYNDLGDLEEAEAINRRCLDLRREIGDEYGAGMTAGAIGSILNRRGEYDRALPYLQEALTATTMLPNDDNAIIPWIDLGLNHEFRGEHDTAITHYNTALELAETLGKPFEQAYSLMTLGNTHWKLGKLHEAGVYLDHALAIGEAIGAADIRMEVHLLLAQIHDGMSDPAGALAHYKKYNEIMDEIDERKQHRRIGQLLVQLDHQRSERAGEMMRLEREELRMELERKNRELAASAIKRCQEQSFLKSLEEQLRRVIAADDHAVKESIPSLLKQIRQELASDSEWEGFVRHFSQVYPEFLQELSRTSPELSPTELKVCSLLKINLASKQIAEILGISPKSVEVYRARIRKKLGLNPAINLAAFLARL